MAILEREEITHESLIAGPEVPILTQNVTLAAGSELKRGTLMTIAGSSASATASDGKANAILMRDVDKNATAATVFTSGYFHRSYLIAAKGDTVEAHEEELREAGIYLASIH